MDYNYEPSEQKRDNFINDGIYQRSDNITSQHPYSRVRNVADHGKNSRYNQLGDISSPTVAATAPQTPKSSFSRPQFQTPFFRSGPTALPMSSHSMFSDTMMPLGSPVTPQSHYGQYGFRGPLAPSSPNMAPARPSTSRYGMADQLYPQYCDQRIADDSLQSASHKHVRPSIQCGPPDYGISSTRSFEQPDGQRPYLPRMQQYEEAAGSNSFSSEGAMRANDVNRRYHGIEPTWKEIEKDAMLKDTRNRQYHDTEQIWKGLEEDNIHNVMLTDKPKRPYQETEAMWKVVDKDMHNPMLKNNQIRQYQATEPMWGGKEIVSNTQSRLTNFPIKNELYNINQYVVNAPINNKATPVPIVMMKNESTTETAQQAKSPLQVDNFRVLSGPLSKVIKWEKIREEMTSLFEVVAPFVAVHPSSLKGDKMIILREKSCPALQCLFQEIDIPLPTFQPGQLVRCVGSILGKNKMRAFSVRAADASEKASLQRLQFICNRVLQEVLEGPSEPSLI